MNRPRAPIARATVAVLLVLNVSAVTHARPPAAGARPRPARTHSKSERARLNAQLGAALARNDLATARRLLLQGADPNTLNPATDGTLLLNAAEAGNWGLMHEALARGAKVNVVGNSVTPLQAAVAPLHGKPDHRIVRALLKRGANPDRVSSDGTTPLFEAVILGHTEIVRELLAHGANPNVRDPRGHTALWHARKHGYRGMVALLKRHRARG